MTISFQLIEIPDNEQVTSRQISLPAEGGTLGRSYECTVQLPDFNRALSRVHAEVRPNPHGGYQVVDRSTNGVLINGVQLGRGASQKISDGDKLKLGAYTLLVSDIDSLLSDEEKNEEPFRQEPSISFNIDLFDEDFQDLSLGARTNAEKQPVESSSPLTAAAFSSDNVLGEDLYGYDPFDDDESWVLESNDEGKQSAADDVVMVEESKADLALSRNAVTLSDNRHSEVLQDSIERLNAVIAQQERSLSASIDRERLVAIIETSLERFLDSFNPSQLEDEFDDYITGWGNKEKKYWALYKKQFQRKQERREFYRLFSSILFEELSDKR